MDFVHHLHETIATYGYFAIFAIVAMESAGIPMPGETVLVTGAVLAGEGTLKIYGVIGAAAAGAIVGDNCGYWVGREFGFPLVYRYGRYVRLDERRLKLGQYLFLKHGGKIVFFGRFVAVLRAFAAFLAGVNRFKWEEFFLYNAAGGIVWASIFGAGGFWLGRAFEHYARPVGARGAHRRPDRLGVCGAVHSLSRAGARGRGRAGFSGTARAAEDVELIRPWRASPPRCAERAGPELGEGGRGEGPRRPITRRITSGGRAHASSLSAGVFSKNASVGPLAPASLSLRDRRLGRLSLHRSDPHPLSLRAAQKVDADRAVDLLRVQRLQEVADAGHRLAVERDDEIAGQQPRLRGRPRLLDAEQARAIGLLEAESERDAARNRRRRGGDADIGPPHAPAPGDLAGDKSRRCSKRRQSRCPARP